MKKLIYPALCYKEDGSFWAEFPDLEGCQTFADTLEELHENAKEALSGYLVTLLEQGQKVNKPTEIYNLTVPSNAFTSLVEADLVKKSTAVKKTLTIPSWLNELAEQHSINFSGTLQEALVEKLGLTTA